MSRIELGPTGMELSVAGNDAYLDDARELESLGYSTIWLPGGQIDSLDRIAEVVQATQKVQVAPGIIPLDVYGADAVARLYAELQTEASDRFVVGLGGPQTPRPLAALNAYLDELDRAQPPVPAERRILAALGPRKLELARERAAGAVPLLVTPAYTAAARAALGADATLVIDQLVVLDTDPVPARATARAPLRFLSTVGGYIANFQRMGFSSKEIAAVGDRLVDELVVWGDADTIAARVAEHRAAGADQVTIGVLSEGDQPSPIDVARRLAGVLLNH